MRRAVPLFVSACVMSATFVSAQPGPPPPAGPPGLQWPPGAPPRDRATVATGTAVIRGRVLAADTGRPLRRARITASAPELGGEQRSTSTGMDGRYELTELPAGRYTIRVTRSGYIPLNYGQRRPFEQGKPFQLTDRQAIDNVDFTLPKGGVIRGQIVDELNEPVADVPVFAVRSMYWQGRRRTVPASGLTRTDDSGEYRIVGLAPGTYFVMANLRETWTVTEGGEQRTMGYSPTYFPGTASLNDARRVTVGVGQDAVNTSFSLMPGRAANISGTAFDGQGNPMVSRPVALLQEMAGPQGGFMTLGGNAMTSGDGTFTLKNISPGQYRMRVQAVNDSGARPVPEVATLPITVDGADLSGVVLNASIGWSFSGRVVTDNGGVPDAPRDRFRLAARVVDIDTSPIPAAGLPPPPPGGGPSIPDTGRVREDWTFAAANAFGPSRLAVSLPDGWSLKAVLHDGRDVTDAAMEMKSGEELSGLQVIVTKNTTTVSGRVTDEKDAPAVDGTVLLFAGDASKWWEDSRWIRAVRPDQQGRYEIKGLPPGDYLAAALNYVEDGIWNDPEYLESIRRYAQKLTLTEGGSQSPTLKLVTP